MSAEPRIIIDLTKSSRQEWLEARVTFIGASDAPCILGVNNFCSAYKLFLLKMGALTPDEQKEAAHWGHLLEPIIGQEFSARSGLSIEKCNYMLGHALIEWMSATPDFWVWENGRRGPLQVKNRGYFTGREFNDGPGDDAHIQVMHEIEVTQSDFGYVAALIGGNRLVYYRVERDQELIDLIVSKEQEFWDCLQTKTPPPLTGQDEWLIDSLYPTAKPETGIDLTGLESIAEAYLDNKALIKVLEGKMGANAATLKDKMGDAERGLMAGYTVSWPQHMRQGKPVRKFSVTKNVEADDDGKK